MKPIVFVTILFLQTFLLVSAWAPIGPATSPVPASPADYQKLLNLVNNMRSRWEALDAACDTNAPFALTYLVMTEQVTRAVNQSYFQRNDVMVNFTLSFAARYLQAIDNPQTATVPWTKAFQAGNTDRSWVLQDTALAISAHVNYDLAIIVYQNGYPANPSLYKLDYDRINDVLDLAGPEITSLIQTYYDPSFSLLGNAVIGDISIDVLSDWRQGAWNNGADLYNAPNGFFRSLVMARITTAAALAADTFALPLSPFPTSAYRYDYCINNPL